MVRWLCCCRRPRCRCWPRCTRARSAPYGVEGRRFAARSRCCRSTARPAPLPALAAAGRRADNGRRPRCNWSPTCTRPRAGRRSSRPRAMGRPGTPRAIRCSHRSTVAALAAAGKHMARAARGTKPVKLSFMGLLLLSAGGLHPLPYDARRSLTARRSRVVDPRTSGPRQAGSSLSAGWPDQMPGQPAGLHRDAAVCTISVALRYLLVLRDEYAGRVPSDPV